MPYCADLFYRYYDGGNGSFVYPTIFLHGVGGTHLSWPHIMRRIPGQRIFALDLPGHGLSETSAYCHMPGLVEHIHHFVQEAGIYSFSIAGHSMGSAVAFAYAHTHPERVRGLALIAFGNRFRFALEIHDALQGKDPKRQMVGLLAAKGFHPSFPYSQRRKILQPLNKFRTSVLWADIEICGAFYASAFTFDGDFPILLVSAKDDQLLPFSDVRQLSYHLPNTSLRIIPKSGHMMIFEQPELVRDELKTFLDHTTASPVLSTTSRDTL